MATGAPEGEGGSNEANQAQIDQVLEDMLSHVNPDNPANSVGWIIGKSDELYQAGGFKEERVKDKLRATLDQEGLGEVKKLVQTEIITDLVGYLKDLKSGKNDTGERWLLRLRFESAKLLGLDEITKDGVNFPVKKLMAVAQTELDKYQQKEARQTTLVEDLAELVRIGGLTKDEQSIKKDGKFVNSPAFPEQRIIVYMREPKNRPVVLDWLKAQPKEVGRMLLLSLVGGLIPDDLRGDPGYQKFAPNLMRLYKERQLEEPMPEFSVPEARTDQTNEAVRLATEQEWIISPHYVSLQSIDELLKSGDFDLASGGMRSFIREDERYRTKEQRAGIVEQKVKELFAQNPQLQEEPGLHKALAEALLVQKKLPDQIIRAFKIAGWLEQRIKLREDIKLIDRHKSRLT